MGPFISSFLSVFLIIFDLLVLHFFFLSPFSFFPLVLLFLARATDDGFGGEGFGGNGDRDGFVSSPFCFLF